jgi:hypothetical protein
VLNQLVDAEGIEPGFLALFGNVHAALLALDDEAELDDVATADRVVLVDDGEAIRLVAYAGPDRVAAVTLSPQRALAIAAQLVASASRRWPALAVEPPKRTLRRIGKRKQLRETVNVAS